MMMVFFSDRSYCVAIISPNVRPVQRQKIALFPQRFCLPQPGGGGAISRTCVRDLMTVDDVVYCQLIQEDSYWSVA